jgi:predicted Rossmann-fold nucleotide-binding protein
MSATLSAGSIVRLYSGHVASSTTSDFSTEPLTLDRASYLRYGSALDLQHSHSALPLLLLAGNNAVRDAFGNNPQCHFDARHIASFFTRYGNKQMICVNGTARNAALPDKTESFLEQLAHRLVEINVGLSSGGAESGAMGASIRAFIGAIDYWRANGATSAEIATILLMLHGEKASVELPQDVKQWGRRSEKQRSLINRTPALHGIGLQDVLLYVEGGLGTFFEIFYPLACAQLADKGIVGVYNSKRGPADLLFASTPDKNGAHFWAPTDQLIAEMSRCGLSKERHNRTLLPLPFGEDALVTDTIDMIVELYQNRAHSRAKEGPGKPRPDSERELGIAALAILNGLGFGPDTAISDRRSFLNILDSAIGAQRTLYHQSHFLNLAKNLGLQPALNYLAHVAKNAPKDRNEATETIKRLSDRPAVYMIGSSKDVHDTNLNEYSRALITGLVERGITLVIDGQGTEGLPLLWSELWVDAMRSYQREHGSRSNSELVRVQLAYTDEEVPGRVWEGGFKETCLPSVLNVETRTAIAGSIGSRRAVVLAPGGHPEMCAFSHLLMDSQLAGHVDGCYASPADRPIFQVLNVPGKPGRGPFYDGLLRQLEVMRDGLTIDEADFHREWFDELKNPQQSAAEILASLR